MKAKYNKSEVMKRSWKLFKSQDVRTDEMFSICLKQSWSVTKSSPSIEKLYKEYYKPIYNFINNKIHDVEATQEITNDTFIKALQNMHLYNSELSKIGTWLHTLAKNCMLDYLRKENKNNNLMYVSDYTDDNGKDTYQIADDYRTDDMVHNQEIIEKVTKAMGQLKPKYKEIAELKYMDGLTNDEIATTLEMPLGSVKGMLFRINEMLQGRLQMVYNQI